MTRIWSDDDRVEIAIDVADGSSRFVNRVYVGYRSLADTIASLESFKTDVHGVLWTFALASSVPRGKTVASRATMYLCSEPALLDRFIEGLRRISADTEGEARLEAV